MDQIRNTMMQHEALFKEQVLALHKLYNIQKSAMQEINRRIYSQAKVLAVDSESVVPTDDQFRGSVLDGKPLRQAYATGLAYKGEPLTLSLRPLYTFKEIKGSGSLWMDGVGVDTLHSAQSKPMKNFDLEKLPEEYTDECESKFESNNTKMVDTNSIVSIRTTNTDEISFIGANLAVIQVDSQSLKQICSEADLKMLSLPCQEVNQNCDKASESKEFEIDVKYFPAVGNSDAYQDSSPSTNCHMEETTLSHQGSSIFTSRLNPLERITKQGQGIISQGSTKLLQDLESDSTSITTTYPQSEEQINCYIGGNSFCKNPVICFQGASTQDSWQCEPNAPNNFFIQTTIDANNDDLKDSSDGSNSTQPQEQKSCKHKNPSVNAENTPVLGYCCEGQRNQDRGEAVKSEHEELPQFVQDGLTPFLSGSPSDSEIKQSDLSNHFNSEPGIKTSSDKPVVVTGSNENAKHKLALHKSCESIAAEILLSFAPSKLWADSQSHGTQIKVESGKSGTDCVSLDKKWNFRERRYANYSNDGGITESIKWAKSVNRRRTSRRPR